MTTDNIFLKIIRKEVPAEVLYEDEEVLAFRDIFPQAPVHILIVPRNPVADIRGADPMLAGKLMMTACEIARKEGLDEGGFRLVTNIGDQGGQTVPHLHIHLLGGRDMKWPPG